MSHLVTRFLLTNPHSPQVDRLLVRVIGHDLGAAVAAGHAQVLEPLEVAALALPVADRVLHEVERTGLAEVGERERCW